MHKNILYIPGIFNLKPRIKLFKKEAKKYNCKVIEFKNQLYSYWEFNLMKKIVDEGVEIIKNHIEEGLYVICHSFGGILFNSMFQKLKKHNVKKLFFFSCPFQMKMGGMQKRKKMLGYKSTLDYNIDTKSYGALFDITVPFMWSKYRNEPHKVVPGGHHYYFSSSRFMKEFFENL
jgi:predicted alpha/beta hydrolase family esterase